MEDRREIELENRNSTLKKLKESEPSPTPEGENQRELAADDGTDFNASIQSMDEPQSALPSAQNVKEFHINADEEEI